MDDWDYYATPITLSFNKKDKFSTIPGFLCTILTIIIIILYFVLRIGNFKNLESYTTTSSVKYNGIGQNKTTFNIETSQVTIAFKIGSTD
jgi:prolipoprotein diacylglyceryltransferase